MGHKFGVIIRSVDERTTDLCLEAAKRGAGKNVHVIRNLHPFSEAVKKMVDIAIEEKYDWYFGLDADIVLHKSWARKVKSTLKRRDIDTFYKLDFWTNDRFANVPVQHGVHLYNAAFNAKILKALEQTKDCPKPEGNIRHIIGAPVLIPDYPIAYHGWEQFYVDIFNRFALRAVRNPEYAQRYDTFREADCKEKVAAIAGWEYGLEHKSDMKTLLDARNKIKGANTGLQEELTSYVETLDEFYETRS